VQQEGLELKNRMEQCENRIHFNEERLQELEQRNARALGDIAQGEERKLVAEQELTVLLEKMEASTQNLERLRLEMQSKREAMDEVERSLRLLQEQLRQAQSVQFGVTQQLNRVRNQITAIDLQKQANASRVEKLSAEKIQLEEERLRLEGRFKEFVSTVEAEKVSAQVRRGTLEEQQQRLRVVQSDLTRVTKELDELLRQQAGCRSRLNVLEQLQASHEGFGAGALAALQQAPQLLGALVDRIRVPQEHILAIESALGHHLQLLLTQEPENALIILTDLKTVKKGRASISPLALYSQRVSTTATPFENESVSSSKVLPEGTLSALQAITCEALVHPLLESLLGNTLIVEDLQVATRIWKETNGSYDFVTHQGELLSRHGIYTGGAVNGNDKGPASILGRKLQIEELQAHLGKIQDQVNESSRSKGALQSEQSSLQANLQQEQAELRTQEVAIATHQGECKALENSVRLLHQKIDTVVYEIESLADQEHQSLQKREEFAAQAAGMEAQERDLQEKISEGNANLEALRSERDAANNSLTETKVAFASGEQLNSSYRQQEKSLDQRIRELSHMVEQRRLEVNSLIERRTQFQEEIQSLQQKIESLHHQREQVNARNAELLSQKQALEREILEKDDHLRDHRRRLTEIQQHRSALEVELTQKGMAAQNLCERTMQKYQIKLQDVQNECLTITMVDEGPAKVEILSPEEMANRGLSTNWNEVGEQVQAMQRRIDEMGPVNLVAIEEYEETEQRFQFLSTQHDDLVKAKEQLLEVITRINTQTREMFSETFNKIRENFSILFTEIFGGGKADLMLVDAEDVLESGIEILARPPGKQLKSITLLSGGEQTMTAVALLFAIYQVKPSPFCVLDELDAPLDESNINRFIGVLKRFLNHSQFIIITHNKRTIATADVIYGVTMQEHGVSKLVSMRFHKATGALTDSTATGTTAQISPSGSTPPATENVSRLPGNGASSAADKTEVKPSVPKPSIGDSVEFVSAK